MTRLTDPPCDLCGARPAADQTFAHHGVTYEIDLCGLHAQILDHVLEPFEQRANIIPEYTP